MTRDRSLIYTAAFLRAMATGMMGVLLGIYLARLDFSPAAIGLAISAGLGGAAVAALLATLAGDGWGRRRMLLGIGALSAVGGVAAALFLLRESLVEMDVPTRQSYVMAVVRPEERTFASGVTHLVRLGGWAAAPTLAGVLMQGVALAAPLFIGAGMKIAYDVLLWRAFREVKPPEERG